MHWVFFCKVYLLFGWVGSLLPQAGFLQLLCRAAHCSPCHPQWFQSTGSGVVHRLCGSAGMRDLPSSEIPPVSPAMAGKFFITEPPGKPCSGFWTWHLSPGLKEAVRTVSEEGDSVAERGSAEDEEGQTLSHPGWWRRLWLVHSLSFVPESPGVPLLPESPQALQTLCCVLATHTTPVRKPPDSPPRASDRHISRLPGKVRQRRADFILHLFHLPPWFCAHSSFIQNSLFTLD